MSSTLATSGELSRVIVAFTYVRIVLVEVNDELCLEVKLDGNVVDSSEKIPDIVKSIDDSAATSVHC